jgi:hypothetical protein
MESDGKGGVSPSEAPSEAYAASVKPPIRVTINPRIRPDMVPSHEIERPHGMLDFATTQKYGTDQQVAQNSAAVVI